VVERGAQPVRGGVAGITCRWKSRRRVAGVRGPLKILQVAARTSRRKACKLVVHVALRASHGHMRASQRKRCFGMVELGARPRRRRMASGAQSRETGRGVIRIRCLIEIREVAAGAVGRRAGELPSSMTLIAGQIDVCAGKRELCGGVVIECRTGPGSRVVTGIAGSRKACSGMRRIVGAV